jgi:hypothetical protein
MPLRFSKHILLSILFLFLSAGLIAQNGNNLRIKKLKVQSDTLRLDTLSMVPGTVRLESGGRPLDTAAYRIQFSEARIIFKTKPSDSLHISYKVFPYLFTETRLHKDVKRLQPDRKGFVNPFMYTAPVAENDIFKMEGLTKSGSISRGVSFGNNQDLAVNSSLNLQLSGKLSNDVDILLAASDQNIPIQPQGNTQNLQEFDKVFIQLSNKTSRLIAGDFMLTKPPGYFMNYNKKAQGIGFSTLFGINPQGKDTAGQSHMRISGNAAVSKGKFGRMQVEGVEGNQGPYVLRGEENAPFIIVLSGSEKVYIDGVLLKRGQEYDYVIDYNTAQVTFTARNLITKDKRIVVEFQYSDKNYARSLITFSDEYTGKNLKLHFNVYSEQDSKNQPLQQSLSNPQKLLLHNIGDTLSKAYYQAVDSVAWSNSLVLYRKVDTTIAGILYPSVYVHSNDPNTAHFQLSFSNLGPGNGDYVQITSSANGRVFQWIAPIGGIHQGSYAPVILLVTPKKKQMLSLGGEYRLGRNTLLNMETAMSNYDQNTFSPYNDEHNQGYAFKLNLTNRTMAGILVSDTAKVNDAGVARKMKDSVRAAQNPIAIAALKTIVPVPDQAISSKWIFSKTLSYEYTQQDFSAIERYRSVEFERDWNIGTIQKASDQHLGSLGFTVARNRFGSLGLNLSSLVEGSQYKGVQTAAAGLFDYKGLQLRTDASLLNSQGNTNNSLFLRHKADLSKRLGRITIGLKEQQEKNLLRDSHTDTLLNTSFNFFEWQAYIQNADTMKNKYRFSYKNRKDYGAQTNAFTPLTNANDVSFAMALLKNPRNDFRTTVTYRQLDVLNSTLSTQKPENSLVGRVEYNLRLLKGFLTSGTFYEAGSGLEQKKEFSYVLVPAGQGQYTWIDYNNDGVKQLNEFEIALFPDQATYIRVFTPTDQYVKAYTNQFSENLSIKPAAIWVNKTGLRKGLTYFSDQASYRVDRKTTDQHPEEAYNPFLKSVLDTSLVTLNSSFRNSVFFNQSDPVFGLDWNYQDIRGKSLLTTGFESRVNDFNEVRIRWNMNKIFGLITTGRFGEKSNTSQLFQNRDYKLSYLETDPKFIVQPNSRFRISLDYKYTVKKNAAELGGESVISHNLGGELKYNILGKGSLLAKLNYIQMNYSGSGGSAVSYEMLDGLKPGKNATWGLSYQRTLSNNIQVNINYDGRQSENSKTIHTGGASVRAFF